MTSLRTVAGWFSGTVAGIGMAYLGILVVPRPANELVLRSLAIDPASVVIAGILAAALPALALRCSLAQVVALAIGGAVLCFLGVNLVHWMALDPPHASANLSALRDWAAASTGVVVAATLSAGIASHQ